MRWLLLAPIVGVCFMVSGAQPRGVPMLESFTYQGVLTDFVGPVNDECDLQFSLWDAESDGTQIGGTLVFECVVIEDGLVNVELDFGPGMFNGDERWLQIGVRCPCAGGAYLPLGRQLLTAAPYAIDTLRFGGLLPSAFLLDQPDVITSQHIAPAAVQKDHMSGGSVGSTHIQGSAVNSSHIANNAVQSHHIVENAIDYQEITANAVRSGEILDGEVSAADLAYDLDSLEQVSGGIMYIDPSDQNEVKINTTLEVTGGEPDATTIRAVGDVFATDDVTALDDVRAVDRLIGQNHAIIGAIDLPDGILEVYKDDADPQDIFNLYDGSDNVFTVMDGGKVGIGNEPLTGYNSLDVAGTSLFRSSLLVGSLDTALGIVDVKQLVDVGGHVAGGPTSDGLILVNNATNDWRVRATVNSADSGVVRTTGPNSYDNARLSSMGDNADYGWIGVYDDDGQGGINNDGGQAGMGILAGDVGVVWADQFINTSPSGMRGPDGERTEIWYVSLEGPEAGCYIRGTAQLILGEGTIVFPDHFKVVASPVGMTVSVTPLSEDSRGLAVVSKSVNEGVIVKELGGGMGTYEFDFVVMAVRKGYEDFGVIHDANELRPHRPVLDTDDEGELEAGQ